MAKRKRQEQERSLISGRFVLKKPRWAKNILPLELRPAFPNQPTTLLTLPGEIRNRIYQYALAEPLGLFARISQHSRDTKMILCKHAPTGPSQSDKTEPNQIKYVCKQLYKETADIELQMNTLTFGSMSRSHSFRRSPVQQLDNFAVVCDKSRFAWIKRIRLVFEPRGPESEYHPLRHWTKTLLKRLCVEQLVHAAQFCRQHPKIKMEYVLAVFWKLQNGVGLDFKVPAVQLVDWAFVLMKALRDVDMPTYPNPAHGASLLRQAMALRKDRNVQDWTASNLTFHPRHAVDTAIRECYHDRGGIEMLSARPFVTDWLALMESWEEQGI
ncbi:hypothetical protein NX059_007120 [Plenodomus lindquistii]|nr:hypothetical protein NX059_007120 [Plenodomus lindquistii]